MPIYLDDEIGDDAMTQNALSHVAIVATFLITSLVASSSYAAKTLPEDTSLEAFTEFFKKAVGDDVEIKPGIGGFVGKANGIDVGYIEGTMDGKAGDTLLGEAIDLMKIICREDSLQLSPVANQTLDGPRLLRRSFSCTVFGPITQYNEALIIEDGTRFQTFYLGSLGENRPTTTKVADGVVAALISLYR
jgi:hypothetical protein